MPKLSEWTNFYHEEVEPRMSTWIGPFIFFFLLLLVEYFLLSQLVKISLYDAPVWSPFVTAAGTLAFAYVLWYITFRRYAKFALDEIGILIALTRNDPKANEELQRVYAKYNHLIATENLSSRVVIAFVPERLIPKNGDQAARLLTKFRARLIVWGQVDFGNLNALPHTTFTPIYFTYRLRTNLPADRIVRQEQGFDKVLANRKWIISDANSILDRQYLAANLHEVTLYMLGVILADRQKPGAIEIMRSVLDKYERKPIRTSNDQTAIKNMRELMNNYFGNETVVYEFWPNQTVSSKKIEAANLLCVKMRDAGCSLGATLLEAQIMFVEKANAPSIATKLKSVLADEFENGLACISLAFIYFYEGDMEHGWLWLRTAMAKMNFSATFRQFPTIIRWYEESLKESPAKTFLHFPIGVLYLDLSENINLAEDSLKQFLKEYENFPGFNKQVYEAKKRLQKIRRLRVQ